MRELILHMKLSVDGFVAAADGDVEWVFPTIDAEVTAWIVELLRHAGAHVMGRLLYHEMADYWPTSTEPYAAPMNEIPKVVFSKSLQEANWEGTQLARGDLEGEVRRLKGEPGGYLLAHGGSRFAQSLAKLGLVDEYRLLVHPVALGTGLPLFAGRQDLRLTDLRRFGTGAVALTYRPA